MDIRITIITIIGIFLGGFMRAFSEDLPRIRNFSKPVRSLITLGAAILMGGEENLLAGKSVGISLAMAFLVSGPSFALLLFEVLFGKKDDGQSGGGAAAAAVFLLAFLLPFSQTSCTGAMAQAVVPTFDVITADVAQVSNIISAIDAAIHVFFALKPDASLEAKVLRAESDLRLALDAVDAASGGAKDLAQVQSTPAFDKFQKAYDDFTALVREAGIIQTAKTASLGSKPQFVGISEPRLLKRVK